MSRRKPIPLLPLANESLPEAFCLSAGDSPETVTLWRERIAALIETMEGLDRIVVLRHEPEIDALYPVTLPNEV